MAGTAPAGSSPGTAAATSCSPRSTGAAWRPSRPAWPGATASGCSAPGWWPRSAAPRRTTSRNPPNGTHARPGWWPNSAWWPLACGSSCAWAGTPGRPYGRCCGQCGFALPRPRPAFGHGAEVRLAESAGAGRSAAHRLLSPKPAEHIHRPGDPGHAGRHFRPRPLLCQTRKLISRLLRANVDLVISYAPQFVCSKHGSAQK